MHGCDQLYRAITKQISAKNTLEMENVDFKFQIKVIDRYTVLKIPRYRMPIIALSTYRYQYFTCFLRVVGYTGVMFQKHYVLFDAVGKFLSNLIPFF